MRIVLIGVSHWHTPFYSEPVLAMPDATIVGVSDPDADRAAPLAGKAKCPVFTDYREMCAKLKPDFAFVLGRHDEMADEARFLIESRIPFAIEKPCALNAAEAHDIARRAAGRRRVRRRAAGDALLPDHRDDTGDRRRGENPVSLVQVRRRDGRSVLTSRRWNG